MLRAVVLKTPDAAFGHGDEDAPKPPGVVSCSSCSADYGGQPPGSVGISVGDMIMMINELQVSASWHVGHAGAGLTCVTTSCRTPQPTCRSEPLPQLTFSSHSRSINFSARTSCTSTCLLAAGTCSGCTARSLARRVSCVRMLEYAYCPVQAKPGYAGKAIES